MKQLFSLFLSIAMASFLITSDIEVTINTTINTTKNTAAAPNVKDIPSTEVSRAIDFGLVPKEIQGDYDTTITFRQYSKMLTNMVRIWDKSRLGEWKKIISRATASDEKMQREDGILATAYAMVLMGKLEYSGNDWAFFKKVEKLQNRSKESPSWKYPLFPTWEDTAFEAYDSNYMWGGNYHVCSGNLPRQRSCHLSL